MISCAEFVTTERLTAINAIHPIFRVRSHWSVNKFIGYEDVFAENDSVEGGRVVWMFWAGWQDQIGGGL